MGVLEPVQEELVEAPPTPPGVSDLASDDGLFAENDNDPPEKSFKKEFFYDVVPVLPYKGMYELIDADDDVWNTELPMKKRTRTCPACLEGVKKNLRKFEDFVNRWTVEAAALKSQNEKLKKEVEDLKTHLHKDIDTKTVVNASIHNKNGNKIDVIVKKCFENERYLKTLNSSKQKDENGIGIKSLAVSVPSGGNTEENKTKTKKTIAQLRKEFFDNVLKSDQRNFTSKYYLELKYQQNTRPNFRSQMNIRVKPKRKIADAHPQLSPTLAQPVPTLAQPMPALAQPVPAAAPIEMFQRIEKSRISWQNDFKKRVVTYKWECL